MTTIAARVVVTPRGSISPGAIEVDDGVITAVGPWSGPAPDRVLCPGFVDLQVNGHDDVDVSGAEGADWERLDQLLLSQGVTTWCPTLVTGPLEGYDAPLGRIAAAAQRPGPRPRIAGAHLEGPFLGALSGAHDPRWVRPIDLAWLGALPRVVALVTLGAELSRVGEAIALLASRGVLVALGHSLATYEEAEAAIDAGARMATHLFNAMTPVHHREPGLAVAALTDERIVPSVIADLVHVHPATLAMAMRARAQAGIALVTDAVAWRAERVAASGIARRDDDAPRRANGTIAGSALTMDRAVSNVVRVAKIPLDQAVAAASSVPARLLGDSQIGVIEPGAKADLVALDLELRAAATWIGGELCWERR
jgi:N-acetylglucosamine-6-phosphate deacetylase